QCPLSAGRPAPGHLPAEPRGSVTQTKVPSVYKAGNPSPPDLGKSPSAARDRRTRCASPGSTRHNVGTVRWAAWRTFLSTPIIIVEDYASSNPDRGRGRYSDPGCPAIAGITRRPKSVHLSRRFDGLFRDR